MIIDCHTHVCRPGWGGYPCAFSSVAEEVDYLRACGVDAALFSTLQGVQGLTQDDVNAANEESLRLMREYDGFLYPGAVLHPAFPDASREWLARFREQGLLWVGELKSLKKDCCQYTDKSFMDLFETCARHGHIVQVHAFDDVVEVAARFPEMPVVFSHVHVDKLARLAEQPNIWQDISGSAGGLCIGALEAAYKAFGAERLLYGTDFPAFEPRAFLARLDVAIRDPEERRRVLAENLIGLLDRVGSRPIFGEKGT